MAQQLFRGLVYGAEVLPFAGAHLRAGLRGAGRGVGEEGDDDGVGLLDEEAAELVEPDVFAGPRWWGAELAGDVEGDGLDGVAVGRVRVGVV